MNSSYITGLRKQFNYYKLLGEKTFSQIPDEKLFWQYNNDSNSIAIIVKHLWGNMISRFTDFMKSDGEKEWRNRDSEFENDITTKQELIDKWNEGWECFFNAFNNLTEDDLNKEVFIRNEKHLVTEALERHLAHCAYHIGQIVFIGKMVSGDNWKSLSIPKGKSNEFNEKMFSKPKE
jgi:hypothetical protein